MKKRSNTGEQVNLYLGIMKIPEGTRKLLAEFKFFLPLEKRRNLLAKKYKKYKKKS